MSPDISIRFNRRQLLHGQAIAAPSLTTLRNWFPVMVEKNSISWRYLPNRFTAPFFIDTLQQQAHAERKVCVTTSDRLMHIEPALRPSAFIFHTSRCGSTLLTQLLSTLESCIVLSEPPAIDAFFYHHRDALEEPASIMQLRQLILALGQQRSPAETHFFIKLDSWHIQYLPLLRKAFPETPCWFLYREPDAIMASHRRRRGLQMIPGMVLPMQLSEEQLAPGDLDGYCAQVLARFFEEALKHADHLRWLHYRQLPNILWEQLLADIDLHCSSQQLQAMQQRAAFHAKHIDNLFNGDPAENFSDTHEALRKKIEFLYDRIEQQRFTAEQLT